jgi:hypothetical protein
MTIIVNFETGEVMFKPLDIIKQFCVCKALIEYINVFSFIMSSSLLKLIMEDKENRFFP